MDSNLPPGVTSGMIDDQFPESLAQEAGVQGAYDWIEGVEHDSQAFRDFIDFCWDKFPNQMRVMIEAYVATDKGEEAFEAYLQAWEDGAADRAADERSDAERDK